MRLLATHHIFLKAAPDTFAYNRLSVALDSGAVLEVILTAPEPRVEEKEADEDAARLWRWKTYGAGLVALIGVT